MSSKQFLNVYCASQLIKSARFHQSLTTVIFMTFPYSSAAQVVRFSLPVFKPQYESSVFLLDAFKTIPAGRLEALPPHRIPAC